MGKNNRDMKGANNPMFGKKRPDLAEYNRNRSLKGEGNPMFGKERPDLTEFNQIRCKMGLFKGEHNPRWRGGVSFEPYCPKFNPSFKENVRCFFNYTCVECGKTTKENKTSLCVHHVNYDKQTCCKNGESVGNRKFVALCRSCHTITNGDREFWEDWYTEIINEFYGGQCYLPKETEK